MFSLILAASIAQSRPVIHLLTNRGVREDGWMRDSSGESLRLYRLNHGSEEERPKDLGLEVSDFSPIAGAEDQIAKALIQEGQKNGGQLILYIHGYNTSVRDATDTIWQIRREVTARGEKSAFAYLSWPSDKRVERYNQDLADAKKAAVPFAKLLVSLEKFRPTSGFRLAVVTHSMGAWVAVKGCVDRMELGRVRRRPIDDLILTAPDLPRAELNVTESGEEAAVCSERVTAYFSDQDFALGGSGLFRGYTGGRLGSQGAVDYTLLPERVTVVNASRDIKASPTAVIGVAATHGIYFENRTFLDDFVAVVFRREFKEGTREPVNDRLLRLIRVKE